MLVDFVHCYNGERRQVTTQYITDDLVNRIMALSFKEALKHLSTFQLISFLLESSNLNRTQFLQVNPF